MTVSVVQTAYDGGANTRTATFGSTPTPGNAIVAILTRNDNPGGSFTVGGSIPLTLSSLLQAHSSFGGIGFFGYRVYEAGDGTTVSAGPSGNHAVLIAELAGLDPAGPFGSISSPDNFNNSDTIALALANSGTYIDIGGFVTRLRNLGGSGIVTPNAETTQINGMSYVGTTNGTGFLGYADATETIGGTQSGPTQDGYWWGGAAISWPLAPEAVGRSHAILIV